MTDHALLKFYASFKLNRELFELKHNADSFKNFINKPYRPQRLQEIARKQSVKMNLKCVDCLLQAAGLFDLFVWLQRNKYASHRKFRFSFKVAYSILKQRNQPKLFNGSLFIFFF